MKTQRFESVVRKAVRHLVSRRLLFRGNSRADGRITLLTVDYHVTEDVIRLIRSFRAFVDPEGAVVVVQNGAKSDNTRLMPLGVKCVNRGINFTHGLGLDWGMRQVETEFTLICDPDTAILSNTFREQMMDRLRRFRVAGVDNGATFYHPICVAFETRLWKTQPISFEQRWHSEPVYDVGGALTVALGGVNREALIPRTRHAGPALASGRAGTVHYYGDVFGDSFTNTYCMSRKVFTPEQTNFDGWTREELEFYHAKWREWVGAVVEGNATVSDFPTDTLVDTERSA